MILRPPRAFHRAPRDNATAPAACRRAHRQYVPASDTPPDRRRRTVLLLALVFAINFMDRQIVAILAEPIRRDLALSDTELGLLYGFAFAAFFTVAGVFFGRLADRGNRTRLIAACLAVFSAMTAFCGLAAGYGQLLAARVGVAVGEGGTAPASHSIIADLYPPRERGTALGILALGPHLGILFGFVAGGVIAQTWGWRTAFVVAGAVGMAIALVFPRLVREPAHDTPRAPAPDSAPSLAAAMRSLLAGQPSARHLLVGLSLHSVAVYAIVGWLPSLLIRSHGFSTAGAGISLALILGVAGALGTFLAGVTTERLERRREGSGLRVAVAVSLAAVPCWLAGFASSATVPAVAALAVAGTLLGAYQAPAYSAVHAVVDPRARATSLALIFLLTNLVGLGSGPLLVGALSDHLADRLGAHALRHALFATVPFFLLAALHFHLAARGALNPRRDAGSTSSAAARR